MKFLNKIDGANRVKQDSNNRFVTDIEKANWNGKAEGNHNHSKNEITDFPTSMPADGGNADTISGFTVGTNVPSNAKFTDTNTTYSEITTAEIDTGTASTLRVITGRRIKYILDKVSSMVSTVISSLTKNDVGLGNVDNIQQATKNEFNSHNADSTRHIVSSERTKWNTVDNKVDKVTGKGLSTNDYTAAEKTKLSGIESGANKTTINNTLTSTSTTEALSANQGKTLKDILDTHSEENITSHNVSRGISTFAGSGQEIAIPHGLPIMPTSAYAFPTVDPEGYLGEVWIRIDETNLYIGNSGSFNGAMSWTAIG